MLNKNNKNNSKAYLIILFFIIYSNVFSQSEKLFTAPEWTKNVVIYEVNVRQFTPEGTFKAFEKHLPRLKKMGVDVLWFMPIHPIGEKNRKGSLGSYYSIKDYKEINPEFGTKEDFKNLVNKIHKMGMYVMMDWVGNHTAWDNVWTKTNPEFFNKNEKGEFYPPVSDWTDVIDLNYDNKELWEVMIEAMKYWVKEYNIDGFRCDYAVGVPLEFWIEARKELEKVKPLFMLAEANEPNLHEAFDATYNWQLKDIMNNIPNGKLNALALVNHINDELKYYPFEGYRLNFTTNHDENSWSGTEFERLGNAVDAFNVFVFTTKGIPLIYSGQESGLNKRLRFFDKDTINWDCFKYEKFFSTLIKLKKQNKALWNGKYGGNIELLKNDNEKNVLSFIRLKDKNIVISIFNFSGENQKVVIDCKKINNTFRNYFTKEIIKVGPHLDLNLKPWEYIILVKSK
ncbi:MAG: alpha-amylase family glycosyl hydrolase [Melioribacter sp.]|nr:alpha-amylase family glycosyl hydrolase [Melioribacter sp.]